MPTYQQLSQSMQQCQKSVNNGGVDWDEAPINYPELVAIRRRREIVIYKPGRRGGSVGDRVTRGAVTAFTADSARRLKRAIDNSWCDFRVFGTLTYGQEYPRDGSVVKKHLRRLWERLRRIGYFTDHCLVWFMEFQARGAPHIHFVATGWMDKAWLAEAWSLITDGDARVCTRIEGLRSPEAAGAYAAKMAWYSAKAEQKDVPSDFIRVGRWWGRIGYKPTPRAMPIWFRAYRRSMGRAAVAMTIPRVAAGVSRESADRAIFRARAGDRAGVRPDALAGVRVWEGEHAVIILGRERSLDLIWWQMTRGGGLW